VRVRVLLLACLALVPSPTHAAPGSADGSLRIEAPASLPIGANRIAVILRPPLGPVMPLLLTVSVEGDALQAVRARFLRADAKLEKSGELRFDVPVLARAAGIALMRAEVSTYRCSKRCRQLHEQTSVQLQVANTTR
jgi:hypothetical protein